MNNGAPFQKRGYRQRLWLLKNSRQGLLAVLSLLCAFLPLASPAQIAPTDEQVMAAFLYNFTNFVHWPDLQSPNAAFEICVWGESGIAGVLENTVSGKSAGTHPIVVRRVITSSSLKSCKVIFFRETSDSISKLLGGLQGSPVLTAGNGPDFAEQGGIVEFFTVGKQVRLRINVKTASQAGLKIDAKLLALAQIVGKD